MADNEIEKLVKLFVADMNKELEKYRKEVAKCENKKPDEVTELKVVLSKNPVSKVRTPKQQAEQVVKGRSWTCRSAHVVDSARHAFLEKNGKYVKNPKSELTDEQLKKFTELWNATMKKHGLLNYKGKHGFDLGDAYHLELAERPSWNDKRVQQCMQDYAEMTRKEGKAKNKKFEEVPQVKKFLKDYEKKNKIKSK